MATHSGAGAYSLIDLEHLGRPESVAACILGTSEGQVFPDDVPTFLGWYAEAIYRARGGWEPAVRFEMFDPDQDIEDDGRTILTGQIAYSFSPNFRWQINVAREDFEEEALEDLTAVVSQWTIRL